MAVEIDSAFVCDFYSVNSSTLTSLYCEWSELTRFYCGGSKLAWFECVDRNGLGLCGHWKWLGFSVVIENDLFFVSRDRLTWVYSETGNWPYSSVSVDLNLLIVSTHASVKTQEKWQPRDSNPAEFAGVANVMLRSSDRYWISYKYLTFWPTVLDCDSSSAL